MAVINAISRHARVAKMLECSEILDTYNTPDTIVRDMWTKYEGRSESFATQYVKLKNFSKSIHQ